MYAVALFWAAFACWNPLLVAFLDTLGLRCSTGLADFASVPRRCTLCQETSVSDKGTCITMSGYNV
jgi:hypothetical protein